MDISVDAFCKKVREVADGLETAPNGMDNETLEVTQRILANAAPRIKVLRTFLG